MGMSTLLRTLRSQVLQSFMGTLQNTVVDERLNLIALT